METSVTVILPTLGRASLSRSIQSIANQTFLGIEVIVIDDSPEQEVNYLSPIKIFRTGGGKGPSYARNLGIEHARTNWVAFLDDDDFWLPTHIEDLLNFCSRYQLDAAFSSAVVAGKIRPIKVYNGEIDPLVAIYENASWRKTNYYLPTPGLIVSREILAHLAFNSNMREREDLWFAHKIFEYQFRLQQSSDVTLVVDQNSLRSISRTSLNADLDWSCRLELISSSTKDNFLTGVAFRNAVLRLDFNGLKEIAKLYPQRNWFFWLLSRF